MNSRISSLLAIALLVALSGCLQLETRIKLNEDGSATITERLQFSKRLLDLSGKKKGKTEIGDIAALLTKESAVARMKQMGKGIALVSHKTRDAAKGARESIAVFKIPDFRDFRYVSPYMANYNYPKHCVLKPNLFPCHTSTWYGRIAGQMAVTFTPASAGKPPRRPKGWTPPPGPTPQQLQIYRDLRPVFRDLMRDFELKLTFESYAGLRFRTYYRYRRMRAGTKEYDLIDFSSKDLDRYGFEFLQNEEIMLELLRLQMNGGDLTATTKGHADNLTVPVYHPRGIAEIYFRPSKNLFDKYMKGKMLNFGEKRGGSRKADFKAIGHRPKPKAK
jgi:hypothetical protein